MSANVTHPVVASLQPHDDNMKVWRYLDFPKLVDFLDSQTLYFARVDTLDDPHEGTLTRGNTMATEKLIEKIISEGKEEQSPAELRASFQRVTLTGRETIYVNCWHSGNSENAAMWKIYGSLTGSVAIQTTYQKLADALPDDIYLGMVRYLDYDRTDRWIPGGNVFYPIVHKRAEYSFEREVRALSWILQDDEGKSTTPTVAHRPLGIKLPIDIATLVDSIRLQPTTPAWIRTTIERLVDKYGWKMKIDYSQLDVSPFY